MISNYGEFVEWEEVEEDISVCPHHECKKGIQPIYIEHYEINDYSLVGIFKCPICKEFIFIQYKKDSHFDGDENIVTGWKIEKVYPDKDMYEDIEFSDFIKDVSPRFCTIFSQTRDAEIRGSLDICGGSYRKALEILIKDYLHKNIDIVENELIKIKEDIDSVGSQRDRKIKLRDLKCRPIITYASGRQISVEDVLDKSELAYCIRYLVKSSNVKICAEHAKDLGNDETHYIQRHPEFSTDQRVDMIRELIMLTINWIEDEEKTKNFESILTRNR